MYKFTYLQKNEIKKSSFLNSSLDLTLATIQIFVHVHDIIIIAVHTQKTHAKVSFWNKVII